jgi:endothelin-converting enzyme/putative endopeptidase
MDTAINPGDDFYNYANGAWIKGATLPPDRTYMDPSGANSSDWTDETTRQRISGLIEEAIKSNAPAGSNARKIADLYNSYMDEAAIESQGLSPLRAKLQAIAAIRDEPALAAALGEALRADVDPLNNGIFHTPNLFGLWVAPGFHDPGHYTAYLMQGGLELPDREYYLSTTDAMRDIRAKYQHHVSAVLALAGFSETQDRALRIIALEQAFAATHVSLADSEDIAKADNTWKQSDFAVKAPGLDWPEFFRAAGLSKQATFIAWQPVAIAGESALVASTALDTWKDWLAFHLIADYSEALPKSFAVERFSFYGEFISGASAQTPRIDRALAVVNRLLGDAIGQMYVQRYFTPDTKSQAQAIVANILSAYRRRIDALPWMDPATKAEAKAKLANLYVAIGYPEKWRDDSSYEIRSADLFGNFWRVSLADYRREVARLGHAVDSKEWPPHFYPQTWDMMQLPLQNAICMPAANFQPPHFHPGSPAVNYGSLGATIGHEISHTFDREGSAFDSTGRVRNWWKADDLAHFNAATAKLAAQYDTYQPFPDLHVNGPQTLDEDIADLGGLNAAYDAYHLSLAGKAAPVEDGFSGDQEFFLGFAQSWIAKSSEAYLRNQVLTGTHAPERYRALTVRNLDSWYAAFSVKPGDKLYLPPDSRVKIW